jgi:hypothetical protein
MYLKTLNKQLDNHLREILIPHIFEIIARGLLKTGYRYTALKDREFVDKLKASLAFSLHEFHGYLDGSIERWINDWNEKPDDSESDSNSNDNDDV